MTTVVFTNQKGGPGKTTLSVLFAQWLVDKQGLRVCFIDLDSQRNASKTLAAFACETEAVKLFDDGALQWPDVPLALVRGSRGLADIERSAPATVLPAFRRQVAALAERFDVVVIDTPPALGLRMSAALMAGTHVVCPIELEEYSVDGVTDMLKTVFGVRQRYNPGLTLLGLVANRFNPNSVRQRETLARLFEEHADHVVRAKISTRSSIPEALASGVPVWRLSKSAAREASAEVFAVFDLLWAKLRTNQQLEANA